MECGQHQSGVTAMKKGLQFAGGTHGASHIVVATCDSAEEEFPCHGVVARKKDDVLYRTRSGVAAVPEIKWIRGCLAQYKQRRDNDSMRKQAKQRFSPGRPSCPGHEQHRDFSASVLAFRARIHERTTSWRFPSQGSRGLPGSTLVPLPREFTQIISIPKGAGCPLPLLEFVNR